MHTIQCIYCSCIIIVDNLYINTVLCTFTQVWYYTHNGQTKIFEKYWKNDNHFPLINFAAKLRLLNRYILIIFLTDLYNNSKLSNEALATQNPSTQKAIIIIVVFCAYFRLSLKGQNFKQIMFIIPCFYSILIQYSLLIAIHTCILLPEYS